ncbi:hypothetical protein ACFFYR_21535 [Paraburkholderia dipogonis]|uniref:hypothetical protein n=1 Tax=Paraburkholderia dipogonis TaxID=1211383 RepID=UPI0035E60CBC
MPVTPLDEAGKHEKSRRPTPARIANEEIIGELVVEVMPAIFNRRKRGHNA